MRLPPPTARTRSGTGSGSDIDETQSPVGLVVKPATLKDTEGAVDALSRCRFCSWIELDCWIELD